MGEDDDLGEEEIFETVPSVVEGGANDAG